MHAENMPEMLLRDLMIHFSSSRNRDPVPYFYSSLQILRGRQVFPQEQHDPVPAGLWRRPSQWRHRKAASVRGNIVMTMNYRPRQLQLWQFEPNHALSYLEGIQVSSQAHPNMTICRHETPKLTSARESADTLQRVISPNALRRRPQSVRHVWWFNSCCVSAAWHAHRG